MNALISACVNRARTVLMLLAFVLLMGSSAYMSIPKESSPDVPIPIIYVSMSHQGISPEDAVNLLIKPMEQELRSIEGLDEMESTAYEGGGNVVLTFDAGFDNKKALDDVRAKVDIAKSELPTGDEADEPRVTEINISLFPILSVILSGDISERELKVIAEDLQDDIEGIGGVLEANVTGIREEQLLIEIDPVKLQTLGLTPSTILQRIDRNNLLVAAGSLELENGRYALKVPGLISNATDLLNLPLIVNDDRMVRIRDVGDVKLTFKDPITITRVDGQRAVALQVKKRIGENIIETVDQIKAVVKEKSALWPQGLTYSFTSDESENIRSMLTDLQNNVMVSVILVMIVVLAALGPRSALLVAVTIPGSFLSAVMLLNLGGFTMNIVVLFALILAVGMLVDGAIVVAELADKKMKEDGATRKNAFIYAAQYMAWPITASTATTLAVFLPLLFWPGIVGEFMKFMPLTLIFTLGASLAMALVFLPTIGSIVPGGGSSKNYNDLGGMANVYGNILTKALKHPIKVLGGMFGVFIMSFVLYGFLGKGVEFFPDIEPQRANIVVYAKGDLSIYEQDKIMRTIAGRVSDLPGIQTSYVTTGSGDGADTPDDQIGSIFLEYQEWDIRGKDGYTSDTILAKALENTKDLYGIRVETQEQEEGPGDGKPIKIVVSGPSFNALPPFVETVENALKETPFSKNVDSNLPDPGIEWALNIDREKAARAGTNMAEIGSIIRLSTNGMIVGTYRPSNSKDEIDIVARLQDDTRSLSQIDDLRVSTERGIEPISHFVTREAQAKVTSIRRLDQKDAVTVEADVAAGGLANTIVQAMRDEAKKYELPRGFSIDFKGEDEDQKETSAFLGSAFLVAIFIMAIILVTQFDSYYQTFIILSAIVFSTAGVFLGHVIMGKPFGIVMSGVGVIALAGIVVNNNIVLIDTFNKLSKTMDWHTALIETGKQRLRPVLLTAITTIVGLIPMAARLNINLIDRKVLYNAPSTQWWDQLASSIIFGLAFATVLTLLVTPCMIALGYRFKRLTKG